MQHLNSILSHFYLSLQIGTHTNTRSTQKLSLAILSVSVPYFQFFAVHCNLDKCTLIHLDGNDSILQEPSHPLPTTPF